MRRAPFVVAGVVVAVAAAAADAPTVGPVAIPAGCFYMGCRKKLDDYCRDDLPLHRVCLRAFDIDRTEVTVDEYAACVAAGACPATGRGTECHAGQPGLGRYPINCVSWEAAAAYCRFRGRRLPTEAEWERAARGPKSRRYPWGNSAPTCARVAASPCELDGPLPVGSKPDGNTPDGISDLAGNLHEYVADWFQDGEPLTSRPAATDPQGPCPPERRCKGFKYHVLKGQFWGADPEALRCSARTFMEPGRFDMAEIGFRCAGNGPAATPPVGR